MFDNTLFAEAEELCENITIINEGKIIKDDNENLLN